MAYKILMADDQPHNLLILKQYLRHTGKDYVTIEAKNGREACDMAYKEQPDLIIMDWEMPVMDGIAAIKELKANEETFLTPIIMATAHDSPEHVKQAMDAGAMDFIIKPSNKVELSARVNSALRIHDLNQENKRKTDEILEQNIYISYRSEYYRKLKDKIFKTFLGYAIVAFLVSVVSFMFFKQTDQSMKIAQDVYDMSTQVYKTLDIGQKLLTNEIVNARISDEYLTHLFNNSIKTRDSARYLLQTIIKSPSGTGFGITDDCEKLKALLNKYDIIFYDMISFYFEAHERQMIDVELNSSQFVSMKEEMELYSSKSSLLVGKITQRVKQKNATMFDQIRVLVTSIVTVSVIFTLFLTVSTQYVFKQGEDEQ